MGSSSKLKFDWTYGLYDFLGLKRLERPVHYTDILKIWFALWAFYIVAHLLRAGIFFTVEVAKKKFKGCTGLIKTVQGATPVELRRDLEALRKDVKRKTSEGFHTILIYHDGPDVADDQKRVSFGVVMNSVRHLDEHKVEDVLYRQDFARVQVPEADEALQCTHPFTGKISIALAKRRVPAALSQALAAHTEAVSKGVQYEIQDWSGVTHYIVPFGATPEVIAALAAPYPIKDKNA